MKKAILKSATFAFLLSALFALSALSALSSCDNGSEPNSPQDTTERLVLVAPNGGQTYHAGDTIPVSFEYLNRKDTTYFVSLWFSTDGGKTFDMPVWGARNTVHWHGSPRKDTTWIIPTDTTLFGNYVTSQAKIRVEDYTNKNTENDASDQSFTILGR